MVTVTLGFFEDVVIPPHKLQHPSRFDQMEQAWVWIYKTEDGTTHDLFMDAGACFIYMRNYRIIIKFKNMNYTKLKY